MHLASSMMCDIEQRRIVVDAVHHDRGLESSTQNHHNNHNYHHEEVISKIGDTLQPQRQHPTIPTYDHAVASPSSNVSLLLLSSPESIAPTMTFKIASGRLGPSTSSTSTYHGDKHDEHAVVDKEEAHEAIAGDTRMSDPCDKTVPCPCRFPALDSKAASPPSRNTSTETADSTDSEKPLFQEAAVATGTADVHAFVTSGATTTTSTTASTPRPTTPSTQERWPSESSFLVTDGNQLHNNVNIDLNVGHDNAKGQQQQQKKQQKQVEESSWMSHPSSSPPPPPPIPSRQMHQPHMRRRSALNAALDRDLKDRLYTRFANEDESKLLLERFHDIRMHRPCPNRNATCGGEKATMGGRGGGGELILIRGPCGSGKASFAIHTLRHTVQDQMKGYFVSGKYDRIDRSWCPYSGFVAAFTAFAKTVLERGPETILDVRQSIYDAVGAEITLLVGMIPALEAILLGGNSISDGTGACATSMYPSILGGGCSVAGNRSCAQQMLHSRPSFHHSNSKCSADTPARCSNNTDAIPRMMFVFKKFLRAICSPERPLVLLLEDVQWADPCSLQVLESIVRIGPDDAKSGGNDSIGLVVIATCDVDNNDNNNNDVGTNDESLLEKKLQQMQSKNGTHVTTINLQNLSQNQVKGVLYDVLHVDGSLKDYKKESCYCIESLSKIVNQQSGGNPAYIVEFIRWLQESNQLYYDVDSNQWKWETDAIELTIDDTRRVGDFLVDKLEQLPVQVKDVMKVSACLGSPLNEQLLEYVLCVDSVKPILMEASLRGVIAHDKSLGGYVFDNDKIQAAAYNLVGEKERELFHLEIGRRVWRRIRSEEELDLYLFTLLSQLHIGRRLITRDKEQVAIATLCLRAGRKAARSSAFRTALTYLEFGISLLGPSHRSWRDHYELTLQLHNACAEMAVCRSEFERMDGLVDEVLKHAKCLTDKSQAYATRIYALGVSEKQKEAIATAREVINGFGESFPNRICSIKLALESKRIKRLLRGKSDEQLLRMPKMRDPEKLACMQVLHLVFLSTLVYDHKLLAFCVLKMVRLTMEHGSSAFASTAFAYYAILCVVMHQDIDSAYRYGELGLKFLDLYGAKEFLPRVYAAYYGFIYPWKRPRKECLAPLLHGHKVGLQTGDNEGAFLCANLYCFEGAESGTPLDVVDREWKHFQEAMVTARHRTVLAMAIPKVQLIHHHMGYTADPLSPKGDLMDYDEVIKTCGSRPTALAARFSRMFLAYTFNDLDLAEQMATELKGCVKAYLCITKVFISFMRGLVALACAREGRSRRMNLRYARKVIKKFRQLAIISPHNCLDKLCLLEAELASLMGKNAEAYSKYVCALAMSKDSGFPFMSAHINEHMARHFLRLGDRNQALPYFKEASRYYKNWGGLAKHERLESEIKALYHVMK